MTEPHRTIGYATVVERLKSVHRICGIERVYAILEQHGVKTRTALDLAPNTWERVIYQCDFIVGHILAWESMLRTKRTRPVPGRLYEFRQAVDQWVTACDRELYLMSPELFDDQGMPL